MKTLVAFALLFLVGFLAGMAATAVEYRHRITVQRAIVSEGGVER